MSEPVEYSLLQDALLRIRELADFRSNGNTDHQATLDRLDAIRDIVDTVA